MSEELSTDSTKEKQPMRFLGIWLSIMATAGMTLLGGFYAHESTLKTQLEFSQLKTYIQCVQLNEKDTCKFILGKGH